MFPARREISRICVAAFKISWREVSSKTPPLLLFKQANGVWHSMFQVPGNGECIQMLKDHVADDVCNEVVGRRSGRHLAQRNWSPLYVLLKHGKMLVGTDEKRHLQAVACYRMCFSARPGDGLFTIELFRKWTWASISLFKPWKLSCVFTCSSAIWVVLNERPWNGARLVHLQGEFCSICVAFGTQILRKSIMT